MKKLILILTVILLSSCEGMKRDEDFSANAPVVYDDFGYELL